MDPIFEAYQSLKINEGLSNTKKFIDSNKSELDNRSVVYLIKIGTAIYDLISNMKELKRVLSREHYIGMAKAIKQDIGIL